MSRIESQAVGGFYKTQDPIRPLVNRHFAVVSPSDDQTYAIVDPCAGEGEALRDFAVAVFGSKSAARSLQIHAIELESDRYRKLSNTFYAVTSSPHTHRGDGLHASVVGNASALWLNPPYDLFRGQRFESRFLRKWGPIVAPSGQMVLIVPEHALQYLADDLNRLFEDIEILRYPEPEYSDFKQVVVLASRRLFDETATSTTLPPIGDLASPPSRLRNVPPASMTSDVNQVDLDGVLAATTAWCRQAGYDRPAAPPQIGLAMRPKPAHVALALGSGVFNGVRLSAPGRADLLAKAVFRRRYVDSESKKNEKGEEVKLVQVERPELKIVVLDLSTGEYKALSPETEPTEATTERPQPLENFADLLMAYGDGMVSAMRQRCPSLHNGTDEALLRPMGRQLFPAQTSAVNAVLKLFVRGETPLLLGEIGSGKCLKIGTEVMLYSGNLLKVEDVRPGDLLMGPDSRPRRVLSTTRGAGPLYEIRPIQGAAWVCNDAHILTLTHSMSGDIVDVPVCEVAYKKRLPMRVSGSNRTTHDVDDFKQFFPEAGVDFPPAPPLPLDPYFFGVWCGDGTKALNGVSVTKPDPEILDLMQTVAKKWGLDLRVRGIGMFITGGQQGGRRNPLLECLRSVMQTGEIPHAYLTASRQDRQAFLAGFLDTDGYLHGKCFEITQKRKSWADAICFVATSLGIRATRTIKYVNGEPYHRLQLSGDFTQLPLRIARKQATARATISRQNGRTRNMKRVNRTGIKIRAVGVGEYAGFELDGDGRFLLGDFTVTHNTSCALAAAWSLNCRSTLASVRAAHVDFVDAFPPLTHIPLVRRVLVVCPPHLVQNWIDETAKCLPDVPVQTLDSVTDVDKLAASSTPFAIGLLSRETMKLGSGVAGVTTGRCPACGAVIAADFASKLAESRACCEAEVSVPVDAIARLAASMRGLSGLAVKARRKAPPDYSAHCRLAVMPLLRLLRRQVRQRCGDDKLKQIVGALSFCGGDETRLRRILKRMLPRERVWSGYSVPMTAELPPEAVRADASSYWMPNDLATTFRVSVDAAKLYTALHALGTWASRQCGERLYQHVPTPRRYPLARYITRKHKGLFDFLVCDEFHEAAGDGSAQERALHRLVNAIPLVLPLTGSLMNGYAKSLFRNLWSVSRRMRDEFAYKDATKFAKLYGYQKRILTGDALKQARAVSFGSSSDRVLKIEGGERTQDAPGVLPTFVLRHVLPIAVTLHKRDIMPDDRVVESVADVIRVTNAEHARWASKLAADLKQEVKRTRFDEKLAGRLFGQLNEYPSYLDRASADTGNEGPAGSRSYTIRYPDEVGGAVVSSASGLPRDQLLDKERWLVDKLRSEIAEGRRVLLFLWHKDLAMRLCRLVEDAIGEKPAFLDADKVPARKRQEWIDKNVVGKKQVMVTNPSCVMTGLNNLIWFSTAVFFENPGVNPFIARQAVGRLDRITQKLPVRVFWPVYEGVQAMLFELLQQKIAIAQQIDGIDPTAALEMVGGGDQAAASMDVGLAIWKYLGGD